MRGNHLTMVWYRARTVAVLLLTSVLMLDVLGATAPSVAAEDQPEEVAATQPDEVTPLLLVDGDPQPTSPSQLRRDNAVLTWTPTGVSDVQDLYDIRVSNTSEIDPITKELTAASWAVDGIGSADYSLEALPAGTYYWQVRSCSEHGVCRAWSDVLAVVIDDAAPVAPIIERTSGQYQTAVTFAGAAEAGSVVTLTVLDGQSCVATADELGSWSCALASEMEYGDYQAFAVAADVAGNVSLASTLEFSVAELFVAPQITPEELPPVLDIIPATTTPENKVFRQPTTSVIDVVNMGRLSKEAEAVDLASLSTDGGIIQSSENGWQVLGMPWFLWLGGMGAIAASWWAFGMPVPRRISGALSL